MTRGTPKQPIRQAAQLASGGLAEVLEKSQWASAQGERNQPRGMGSGSDEWWLEVLSGLHQSWYWDLNEDAGEHGHSRRRCTLIRCSMKCPPEEPCVVTPAGVERAACFSAESCGTTGRTEQGDLVFDCGVSQCKGARSVPCPQTATTSRRRRLAVPDASTAGLHGCRHAVPVRHGRPDAHVADRKRSLLLRRMGTGNRHDPQLRVRLSCSPNPGPRARSGRPVRAS